MKYPIKLNFKKIALAKQAQLTDAAGEPIAYARQKMFKLKEELEVFRDKSREERLCLIKADRVIDFSAAYQFLNEEGAVFGVIKREGLKSIWKATYHLNHDANTPFASIREEKPFAKLADALVGGIPLVGLFCNYFFNPSYLLTNSEGVELFRIRKTPSFFGSVFDIDKLSDAHQDKEVLSLMGILMMVFLEKARG